jgi:maltooligosyltrehalose synthase
MNSNCRYRFVNGQTTASSFLFLLAYRTYAKRNGVARTHACHVAEMTRNPKGARCSSRAAMSAAISRLIPAALCGYADKAGSAPSRVCVLNFGIYETSER